MNRIARMGVAATCVALAACSALEGDRIDYKSATKAPTLEVPPDLTQLSRDSRYQVPGSAVTASTFQQNAQTGPSVPTAVSAIADVRVERAGSQRWLVVNRPADQLWNPIREFWQENGFVLATDQADLGIMETDWAENRARLQSDPIRNTLGRWLDMFYSTAERDRFRTRLERRPDGGTEVFISHRGVQEVYTSQNRDSTVWQPRPADPELEAEFLRKLMVKLGLPQEQAQKVVASGQPRQTSRVATVNNVPVVQIDEGFDRAWRRVGLALDRTGFTVEDRDRAQGTYFVRYVPPNPDRKDPGFLGRLFGPRERPEQPLKFRIAVRGQGESTTVSVLNAEGAPETSANAQRIVQVIADDLK